MLVALLNGCTEITDPSNLKPYDGPMMEVADIETLYSDSAVVRVKLVADRQIDFESGDREYPEGVYIEFFEVDGSKTTTIKADKGYYNKKEELYTGIGDVVVRNIVKNEQLNTEELHWKQPEERIFTDKFVRIETEDNILTGEGLESDQNFEEYRILKPIGDYSIKESDETP